MRTDPRAKFQYQLNQIDTKHTPLLGHKVFQILENYTLLHNLNFRGVKLEHYVQFRGILEKPKLRLFSENAFSEVKFWGKALGIHTQSGPKEMAVLMSWLYFS